MAGRGAGLLGLEGVVDAAQFNAMIAGLNPPIPSSSGRCAIARATEGRGFDLTFGAQERQRGVRRADAQTSAQLVAAHEARSRPRWSTSRTRRSACARARGAEILSRRWVVAAAYRHRMSRSLDPQLHTHVVCANVAAGPDGRWTALEGRRSISTRDGGLSVPVASARRGA